MNQNLTLAVLVQQVAVIRNYAGHRCAKGTLCCLTVGSCTVYGIHKRGAAGLRERADLAEPRHILLQIRRAVISHDRTQRIVCRMGSLDDCLILRLQFGDAAELLPVERGIDGGENPARRTASHQLFRKPEVCLLIAQRHMGSGYGHHIRRIVCLPDCHLYFHCKLYTGTKFAVQHCLFFFC